MDVRDLERRLTAWSPEELTALLERRGDVLRGRPPESVAELGRRLAQPSSVVGALRGVTLPQLQALDALVALGERASLTALAELLAGDGPGHERDVDAALADLAALALVATDGSGRVDLAPGVTEVVIQPLSLDAPARELFPPPSRRTSVRSSRS